MQTMDVLSDEVAEPPDHMKYDLLLDKGTFDAISLMEDFGSEIRERYLKTTCSLLKEDGLFLITTCNWTGEEIVKHMATCTELILNCRLFPTDLCEFINYFGFYFSDYSRTEVLPTPSMQFGGKQGNKVSVVVFRKNCS